MSISSFSKNWWAPVSVCALLLKAFTSIRPVEIPTPATHYASGTDSGELIIFLPGIGDDMGVFERSGFIDQLRASKPGADSVVVDSHIGYYVNRSLPSRIYQDILLPYREKGYERFILVGISLGGYGALWVNNEYPEWISGTVLISPLLGRRSLVKKISDAESVHSWRSQLDHDPSPTERPWVWIDDMIDAESAEIPALILAFGSQDKFQQAGNLLAESVPESHVFRNGGSHDWQTWAALWREITQNQSWNELGETK